MPAVKTAGVLALQIDFDARQSERLWYAALLRELRQAIPASLPLTITALESWCEEDGWIRNLPVADATPMLFRMGPEDRRSPTDFPAKVCRASIGVSTDELFVGLGSSEIIDLASRVLLRAGLQGLTSYGSYAPFSVAIRASGAELVLVPQRQFAVDLEAMAKAITQKTGVIYLANPNNPTGTAFRAEELEQFLESVPDGVLVVLDEAYIHYAPSLNRRKSEEIYRRRKNLLILRTFSKVYGLAGMRIGFAIGRPELLSAMNRLKTPFNTSGVAQAGALAALDDREHVDRCITTNAIERKRLSEGLTKLGLRPVPSETNFIFMDVGPEAKGICDELLHLGVIVRPLG